MELFDGPDSEGLPAPDEIAADEPVIGVAPQPPTPDDGVAMGDEVSPGGGGDVATVEITPELLLEYQTLTAKVAEASDTMANLKTEVDAIEEATDAILAPADHASDLIDLMVSAANDVTNPKRVRIQSVQALAEIVAALGDDAKSQKELAARLEKVKKSVSEVLPAARDARSQMTTLRARMGEDLSASVKKTVSEALDVIQLLDAQIQLYEAGTGRQPAWKPELEAVNSDDPETLFDKVTKLGNDIPGRDESAGSALLRLVTAGRERQGTSPSADAARMSRVAFDAVVSRPVSFLSRLQSLLNGELADVDELHRRTVDAIGRMSAEDARAIGTGTIIQGILATELERSDRLTRVLSADAVIAMVTAEKPAKRSGLVSAIAELLLDEEDTAVKARLTRALQIVATDVQPATAVESDSVAQPVSRTGEVNHDDRRP